MSEQLTCKHLNQSLNGVVLGTAEFVCPWRKIERLERELAHFTASGIVEIAVRNPSVAEYCKHWEGRAEKAEAERDRLRAALQEATSTLQDLAASCRAYGHNLAATAAEACEQHCRAALSPTPAPAAEPKHD